LEKRPLGGEGLWSICEESQLLPWLALLASIDGPGKVVVEERDLSQAALVSASTGHVSVGVFESFDILSFVNEAEYKWSNGDVKLNDTWCMKLLEPLLPSNFRFDEADHEIPRPANASDRLGASIVHFKYLDILLLPGFKMTEKLVYQASTTAPVNIAVVKYEMHYVNIWSIY
jgi:hypothetical protein